MRVAIGIVLGIAVCVAVGVAVGGLGCAREQARPEPTCTAGGKEVECWWTLYGCMPELSPRDACLAICREQTRGQLKVCEGQLPHQAQPVMLSVRGMTCDRCVRFSDQPLVKKRGEK